MNFIYKKNLPGSYYLKQIPFIGIMQQQTLKLLLSFPIQDFIKLERGYIGSSAFVSMLYAQRIPPHSNTRLRWANLLDIKDGQRHFIIYTSCLITPYFDFYKVVRAYTVATHVYEQCVIDHMKNKTFLSSIQII